MTREQLINKIDIQEEKYRIITTELLKEIFKDKLIAVSGTPYGEGVDIRFSAYTNNNTIVTYDVENKERNKSTEDLIKYPTSELKKSKYENMLTAHTNNKLIYIQYVNETAIIYDMDKLNWDKIKLYNWKIKHTQYDDESEFEVVPTYFIPYYQRIMMIDAHKYFDYYYANNQP